MSDGGAGEQTVQLTAPDGWVISGSLHVPHEAPAPGAPRSGALLVPASRHERDGYGPTMLAELGRRGIASLRIDVRGRGDSRSPVPMYELPPGHRRRLPEDVAAALDLLAGRPEVDDGSLVVVAEQDLTDAAIRAGAGRRGVAAFVLLSPRLTPDARAALAGAGKPVLVLASKEDRRGLDDGVAALGSHPRSSLRVLEGLGFGTTMFSSWQFLHRGEDPLEAWIAAWVAEQVPSCATNGVA